MPRKRQFGPKQVACTLAAMAVVLLCALPPEAAAREWPQRFEHEKATVIMYQPQVESFTDNKLTGRAAVSVKKKDMKEPVFGVIWLEARAEVDRDTRKVTLDEVKVTEAAFKDAKPEQLEALKTFLTKEMDDWTATISLDRLLAALELVEKEKQMDQGLKNEPPKIIFKTVPAVLVPLDGEPKLLPVPDAKLMRVANTAFLMVYDPAGKAYFLKGGDRWLTAAEVQGPWKDAATLPEPVKALQAMIDKDAKEPGQKAPKQVEAKAGKMPEIVVSMEPAELIVTAGEPQYTPITGTGLLFIANTESEVFQDTGSQEYYVLLSGRWFKSKSLADGPWTHVPSNKLPADFAKIPPNSTKGFVLASVGGTTQAKEALLENQIPQTAVIDRKKATTKVKYAGAPKFSKIPETSLEYAVNTGTPVFKDGTKYYAVDNGVWYEADSPEGPWKVSVKPPQDVEKIPPSNPHYNTKYVKVYASDENTATVGYTPAYTGSYSGDGNVVYGTGYQYPAYSTDDAYIPTPATYGYSATYDPYAGSWGYQPSYYNPGAWLGAGLATAAAAGLTWAAWDNWWDHHKGPYYGGGGWWGANGYHYTNINNIHGNVIGRPWRPAGGYPGYRPGQPGVRPMPYQQANLYNRPGNQQLLASRPGAKPATLPAAGLKPGAPGAAVKPGVPGAGVRPGAPGTAVRPGTRPAEGVKPGARPGAPGQVAKPRPQTRPAGGPNNVFGDKQGNVYRKTPQGQWQQRQGNQWQKPGGEARPQVQPRPQTQVLQTRPQVQPRPSYDAGRLNQEFQARQRGEMRTQQFQRSQQFQPRAQTSYSRPGGGGYSRPSGGFQGGGGRGGGGGGRRR